MMYNTSKGVVMTAKKFLIYVVIIMALFSLVEALREKEPKKKTEPIVYFKDEKTIRDLLMKEAIIKDVTFNETGWVYVGIYSDGTNRNGYAEYLCTSIKPFIGAGVNVKIVDYKDVLQKKVFTEIGKAKCL